MTNFEKSGLFNELFGNVKGDPKNIDWEGLASQLALIREEFEELSHAVAYCNIKEVRDGAADLLETTYGLFHRAGFDANKDYHEVWESNMSKFCTTTQEAVETAVKYEMDGVTSDYRKLNDYIAVVSNADQTDRFGKFFPKGKLLKSVNFKNPEFA